MYLSRRDLIKSGFLFLSSSILFNGCSENQIAKENLRQNKKILGESGKPKVVVVKGNNIEKNLDMGFDSLGDVRANIKSGSKIVIKPNFVTPEPYPATTDVSFILSVVKKFLDMGFSNIKIIDCSHKSCFDYNKIIEKSSKLGVEAKFCEPNDLTKYKKRINPEWHCFDELMIQKDIADADFIVNLPVLKRHNSAGLSCAMKNHFGSVNGSPRYVAHGRYKIGNTKFFMDTVAEFADAVRPEMTIVDARDILVRNGPSLAEGDVLKGYDKLIISSDMVAIDSFCSVIMEDVDPSFSIEMIDKTLDRAVELGLGVKEIDKLDIKDITA